MYAVSGYLMNLEWKSNFNLAKSNLFIPVLKLFRVLFMHLHKTVSKAFFPKSTDIDLSGIDPL